MPTNQPAGTNDYVYPGMIEAREQAAIEKADREASGSISNPIVRDIIPYLDFESGSDNDWDGDATGWNFTNSSGTGGSTTYEAYEIDSDTGKADERVTVIYGFEAIDGAAALDAVNFNASDGQTFERAQVEGLDETGDTAVDRQKTLRSPIVFGAQENGTIDLVVNDNYSDADSLELKLLGVTAEKTGRRVGTRS